MLIKAMQYICLLFVRAEDTSAQSWEQTLNNFMLNVYCRHRNIGCVRQPETVNAASTSVLEA